MELRANLLTKEYRKGVRALDSFSYTFHEGIYGLLGPNGAGKSTLMGILAIVVILATASVTLAYHGKKKERERIVSEQSNERAIVTIPSGITKIRIVDGTYGDVLTLDGDSIEEFFTKIDAVSGKVEYVPEGDGYQYGVNCYRGDEGVLSFSFLTETTIKDNMHNMGDRTDRLFTSEEAIPAYSYIQRMFEDARAKD